MKTLLLQLPLPLKDEVLEYLQLSSKILLQSPEKTTKKIF